MEIGIARYSSEEEGALEDWVDFTSDKLSDQQVLDTYNRICKMYRLKVSNNIKKFRNDKYSKIVKPNAESPHVVIKLDDVEIIEEFNITKRFRSQLIYYLNTGKTIQKK